MNVYDNIAFGLTIKKEPKDVIAQKVMRMLRLVSLEDYADRNVTSSPAVSSSASPSPRAR